MTVYFIGAGPGDPELLTLKGARLIGACQLCLYAGSLVPEAVVDQAAKDTEVIDTASLTLQETHALIVKAHKAGHDVARLHSGDPSLYGAIAEQIRLLNTAGITFEIIPGVPAYAATAAAAQKELTLPDVTQSVVLTRSAIQSTALPPGEDLENFARTGATLAIHLGIRNLRSIVDTLTPYYGADAPVIVGYRIGWPDQLIIKGHLHDIRQKVRKHKITRTALILVGRVLGEQTDFSDSALYDAARPHLLRPVKSLKLIIDDNS